MRGVQTRAAVPLVQGMSASAMLSLSVMVGLAGERMRRRTRADDGGFGRAAYPPVSRSEGGGWWMEVDGGDGVGVRGEEVGAVVEEG